MKVKALKLGYYSHQRRRIDEEFILKPIKGLMRDDKGRATPKTFTPEEQFSKAWMERVEDEEVVSTKGKKKISLPVSQEIFQDDEVI